MEEWLVPLLQRTAVAYRCSTGEQNKELYLAKLKDTFIETATAAILERCKDKPGVTQTLTQEIFSGETDTLLKKACAALYKNYIETDGKLIEIIIGKKNFEKLNVSPHKFFWPCSFNWALFI